MKPFRPMNSKLHELYRLIDGASNVLLKINSTADERIAAMAKLGEAMGLVRALIEANERNGK